MSLTTLFQNLIDPIIHIVDQVHTSEHEKLALRNELQRLSNEGAAALIQYEKALFEARSRAVVAEAQGRSVLQRNWRPITMLTFLALVVADAFGWTEFRLSEQAWELLKIGLGGYVVGRSVEKITPAVVDAIKVKGGK